MRTTIEIDAELLSALKELARQQGMTLGQVISTLTRRSLPEHGSLEVRNGVRLFASKTGGAISDLNVVNALRDDL